LLLKSLVANAADVARTDGPAEGAGGKHHDRRSARRGLMIGVGWCAIGRPKARRPRRDAVVTAAFNRGLLVLGAGRTRSFLAAAGADERKRGSRQSDLRRR
jgi:hypothetical protein